MTASSKLKSQQLSVKIHEGQLQISIGVALLAYATQYQNHWPEDFYVSDIDKFAKSLARQLKREQEDGTTPVHRMLDDAAQEVIEQGDDGVDEGNVEAGIALAKAILDAKDDAPPVIVDASVPPLEARGSVSGSTVSIELEGTVDQIDAAIAEILGHYPTPAYGTWFNWPPGLLFSSGEKKGKPNTHLAPIDLGGGRWIARGTRSTSSD